MQPLRPLQTPPLNLFLQSMNQIGRSKTGSGDVLIKDVCSWYSFPSLMNSRFGSHKDVSHTHRQEIEVPKKNIYAMHWLGLWWKVCGYHRVTVDYASVTLFENLKVFPERFQTLKAAVVGVGAQSFIPACSVIGADAVFIRNPQLAVRQVKQHQIWCTCKYGISKNGIKQHTDDNQYLTFI